MKDYINREWLLNEYDRQHKGPAGNARKLIENAPAADVAPVVRGHLTSTGMDEAWCEWGDCSVCGGDNIITAKFCNWCGARMDGDADE